LVGRTERDGVHARRLGDVERALKGLIGKKESEKIVSVWRRYVDVSISMVESTCESAVGKGRDDAMGPFAFKKAVVSLLYTYQ
jgi:hypothetical protein